MKIKKLFLAAVGATLLIPSIGNAKNCPGGDGTKTKSKWIVENGEDEVFSSQKIKKIDGAMIRVEVIGKTLRKIIHTTKYECYGQDIETVNKTDEVVRKIDRIALLRSDGFEMTVKNEGRDWQYFDSVDAYYRFNEQGLINEEQVLLTPCETLNVIAGITCKPWTDEAGQRGK